MNTIFFYLTKMILYTQSTDGAAQRFSGTAQPGRARPLCSPGQGGHTEQSTGTCNTGLSSKIPLGILKPLQGVIKAENCNDLTVLQHNNPSFA